MTIQKEFNSIVQFDKEIESINNELMTFKGKNLSAEKKALHIDDAELMLKNANEYDSLLSKKISIERDKLVSIDRLQKALIKIDSGKIDILSFGTYYTVWVEYPEPKQSIPGIIRPSGNDTSLMYRIKS